MTRTIISLKNDDKKWLDDYSHLRHQSMAETIRQALKKYREWMSPKTQNHILHSTHGLWKRKKIDGLKYTKQLRDEWDRS